jgi:hypothetical protein
MSNVAKLAVKDFVFVAHPLANTFPMIQGRSLRSLKLTSVGMASLNPFVFIKE